ncbi:group II intron-encoded protein LtrA-like [Clytia hemisphaerica]|uniref:group II intron-encoded protein LtrA-like n=1 Tax=Clytia hemisphaerica TaxID=252671 RepID=UPI0034D4D22F
MGEFPSASHMEKERIQKDPKKYRGISIGSTVCKLLINLILDRLRPWYELQLSDEQNGFRKDRGTTEGIYTIKRIQQITDRKRQPLFLLFADLMAAFDHIPRDWLFESIRLRFDNRQSTPLFDILEKFYLNTSLTYEDANKTFQTSSGVRQGGPESPFLFNLYIDFVMRLFKEKSNDINFFKHKYRINLKSLTRTQRYQIRNKNIQTSGQAELPWIGYADDLVLFFTDKESLLSGSELLNHVFESFGLLVNKLKTETMVLNHQILEQHNHFIRRDTNQKRHQLHIPWIDN